MPIQVLTVEIMVIDVGQQRIEGELYKSCFPLFNIFA
jgi:hypothetical protein